jgi:FkbM family methyltransferase
MNCNKKHSHRRLETIIFGTINAVLSKLAEKTNLSKRIFDFYGRILPIPQTIVRGVPIKIIIPLNQVGVYNTMKNWEEREPEVLDWIDSFAEDSIYFDVGASFGTETLYAALKKNGPKKIVSFDLSLVASFDLAYNIRLNNINNVDQYFIALSDSMRLIQFLEPTNYHHVTGMAKYDFLSLNTMSISLDNFVKYTLLYPDYIKIDVDGAEESIILGMTETVKNERLRSVVVEVSDQSEPVMVEFFGRAGFKIKLEHKFKAGGDGYKNIIFIRK